MSDQDRSAIARQLAALGEDPPSEDELQRLGVHLEHEEDVAAVAALVSLSQPLEAGLGAELSDIERARAWRRVESRSNAGRSDQGSRAGAGRARARRPWLLVATGLAAAAAITFVVLRPAPGEGGGSGEDPHEMAIALGAQARAGLRTLGVGPGGESRRAQAMVQAYEARLLGAEGAG